MGCPHFKKTPRAGKDVGTCKAHDNVMIPSLAEMRKFCMTECYDECETYLKYIERCTKLDFPKIMQDLNTL